MEGGLRVISSSFGTGPAGGREASVPELPEPEQPGVLETKTTADTTIEVGNACIGGLCGPSPGGPYPLGAQGFLKLRSLANGIIFADESSTRTSNGCTVRGCHDWQLQANESTLIGDFFALYDVGQDGGILGGAGNSVHAVSVPFRVDANAPTDSLRVLGSTGNVGMGTATPVEDLEIFSADPTIRLSDDAGFEWSLNNSAGSRQFDIVSTQVGANPVRHFFVERGAPADQLMLTSTGIGVGTENPNATLEIEGNSGTSQLLIDERGADANVEVMFNLVCNCAPGFRMNNSTNGQVWFFRHTSAGDFSFDDPNSAGLEARLDSSGNMFLKGSLSQGSSRALKENLEAVNGEKVLDVLTKLDLYEWSYIDEGARHFGPMAEEFAAAYGLGESRAKIAPADMAGVALASSKALRAENADLRAKALRQQKQLESLLERVVALENLQH